MPHSLEEYINLATKDIQEFMRLCSIYHPYKEKEEEIFKTLYEDEYRFNYFEPIEYAKKSSKVLLNVLKRQMNDVNKYYIYWFSKEAFSEEVIEYIDKNDLIDEIFNNRLSHISELNALKLKKHREFIFELDYKNVDEKIVKCLGDIEFRSREIEDYIKRENKIPPCLKSSLFILYILRENTDNIKYFNGDNPSNELINYLISHDYIYQLEHNKVLLLNEQLANNLIIKGNINILLENNLELNQQSIKLLVNKLIEINHNCLNIINGYLLNNKEFLESIVKYLKISNLYNLDKRYLISNLGRSLDKLCKIFSNEEIQIIKREIIENNYSIDMLGILDNIDLNRLKNIYEQLHKKENKFNENFSFYQFIKVMDYFANHLDLVKELNKNEINNQIIDSLALAINCNDDIDYEELKKYKLVYKSKIRTSDLSIEDKIYRLLINSNRGESFIPKRDIIDVFLEDIFDIVQLTYLQLEFPVDSNEYKILESYIELSKILHNIKNLKDEEVFKVYNDLFEKFNPSVNFDIKVIRENLLRLQAKVYHKNRLNLDELRQKGKYQVYNNCEICDITGEKFNLYTHNEEFHPVDDDFTSYDLSDVLKNKDVKNNYICCEFASELSYDKLTIPKMSIYSLENPTSLIAFGNRDIWIKHTTKPLIQTEDRFVNQYDMAFFNERRHASTEFDFLRVDDLNKTSLSNFKIVKNMESAIIYANNYSPTKRILIFNEEEHEKRLMTELKQLKENVANLGYKELIRLIALSTKFMCLECFANEINTRINDLGDKEQFVLKDTLNRYSNYLSDKKEVRK